VFFRTTWISSTLFKVSILLSTVHVYLLINLRIELPYIIQQKGGLTPVTQLSVLSALKKKITKIRKFQHLNRTSGVDDVSVITFEIKSLLHVQFRP